MTADVSYTCAACRVLVTVPVQLPRSMPLREAAQEIAAIEFEAEVTHDIREHLDEVTS